MNIWNRRIGARRGLAAFATIAMVAIAPGIASAAANNHFGVVCLRNDTKANISYLRKVGNGGWEKRFLAPGGTWRIAHRYDFTGENKSPPVTVKYDADARAGSFQQFKELSRRAAVGDTCREAHVYAFQYERANRNFIKLDRVQ
jgi:hypothetical protein